VVQTKGPVKEQILRRFEAWLDDVLTTEKPLAGIEAELLSELKMGNGPAAVEPTDRDLDLYSAWSAMTALTQEVKLQGRAFKRLSDEIEPLTGIDDSIDRLLEAQRETRLEVGRMAEEARGVRTERENKLRIEARNSARREFIMAITDIRDRLLFGLRAAAESRRKLDENSNASWLNRIFLKQSAGVHHMLGIVRSLRKGYRLGLERLDEAMQQMGVHEIVCEGKPFDPRLMSVVDVEETVDAPDGMVLEVYRTGYMIDTEVLKSAQVKVARAPEENI
jgi:molecular chaperone GrpE